MAKTKTPAKQRAKTTKNSTAKKELPVEDKLRALYDLQLIDSRIDEIKSLRGELPLEVRDLEDEISGLNKRLEKLQNGQKEAEESIKEKGNSIEESRALIKKYSKQQDNVRNNREYNSLSKEIEFQELEIQLAEKQIREHKAQIEQQSEAVEGTKERIAEREEHLKHKQTELDGILTDTEKEEKALLKKSGEFQKQIEGRLLSAYQHIRAKVRNGLAIVPVERGASGGSFFTIPPQVQMEIATRKRIIIDEHSGRILIDMELAKEEQEKIKKLIS